MAIVEPTECPHKRQEGICWPCTVAQNMPAQAMGPFLVQAHRPGQFTIWVTDSRHDSLLDAVDAAQRLHEDWDRRIRLIDQEERVLLRLPIGKNGRWR